MNNPAWEPEKSIEVVYAAFFWLCRILWQSLQAFHRNRGRTVSHFANTGAGR
jgi:hypothetical protein